MATSQNNVEYRLNYNKFYQGRIDCSFCEGALIAHFVAMGHFAH